MEGVLCNIDKEEQHTDVGGQTIARRVNDKAQGSAVK
jgi:hypothetical protein